MKSDMALKLRVFGIATVLGNGFNVSVTAWSGNIVFEDNFDGSTLNLSKWEYQTGCSGYGEGNLECYRSGTNNVQVKDGSLVITAKIEKYQDKDYTSGRIRQLGNGFTYGAYVARARLPKGKHLWPAFWMLRSTDKPGKFEEIDILEYRGQQVKQVELTAHYGHDWENLTSNGSLESVPTDLSVGWHEFAVLWLPDSIEWYVDNVAKYKVLLDPAYWRRPGKTPEDDLKPFAEPNNFIVNLGVGGEFFQDYGKLTLEEARQWPKNTYEVDWVRVYQQ